MSDNGIEMEFFHTLKRGVDERKIFLDTSDYLRFIHDMYEFNDEEWVITSHRFFQKNNNINNKLEKTKRKLLVDIHAFISMPNHFHLLLSPRIENGVSRFMHKLSMGYSKYFNEKYERKGTLFEGRYKSISITNDAHFIHLPYYIHLNALDLFDYGWRSGNLKNIKGALDFLKNYRWSSYLDYCGEKNFPSVTERKFLLKIFDGEREYEKSIEQWLKNFASEDADIYKNIKDIFLE